MATLVLGDGLLGSEIIKQTGWDYASRKKNGFDFTNLTSYYKFLLGYDTIVNCIGHTKTYSSDREAHWNVNYVGVSKLVDYCEYTKVKLIHMSTDYLYAGANPDSKETDVPVHISTWYGYTKLLGEGYVQLRLPEQQYLIVRTSFKKRPFPYPKAFLNLTSNAVYVDEAAEMIIGLIDKNAYGIYNVGCTKPRRMYDLAVQTRPDVKPVVDWIDISMPEDVSMCVDKMNDLLGKNDEKQVKT